MLVQDILPPQKVRKFVKKEIKYVEKRIKRLSPFTRFGIFTLLFFISLLQVGSVLAAKCSTPTITPSTGTYNINQTVGITTGTTGATICYTTDSTTPASSSAGTCATGSTTYTGSFTVSATTTVKAIATKSGNTDSSVASNTITLQAVNPSFNPAAGTYSSTQYVTISTTTSGAIICYRTDGTDPTISEGACGSGSTQYSSQITVAASTTFKAIAGKTGWNSSSVITAAYTIGSISNDATLSNLTISVGALSPAFAPNTTSYTAHVGAVSTITVTPTTEESHATITVNGNSVTSGNASQVISLNIGSNTITVAVTAQDTTTTKTYTVTASKMGSTGGVSGSGGGFMMF